MRIAILWTGLSGYMNACLKELASREDVEIFVSRKAPVSSAPYDDSQFNWIKNSLRWSSSRDLDSLGQGLRDFDPDILVMASWAVPAYRKAAKEFKDRSWRVMIMDNGWRGTLKQRVGTWSARVYVHPIADAVWLPGERQAVFARRLGFKEREILRGSFSCDLPAIETPYLERVKAGKPLPHAFLYVGRFISIKGIEMMVDAYKSYRESVRDPWPLVCCGAGPLKSMLEVQQGIRVEGFVQPSSMPEVMASAGCLILPSQFEPWALVVHEAASAGLAILASEKVGAVVHLVQPGYNGFVFDHSDQSGLTMLMQQVSAMSDERLESMSRASNMLAQQYSPHRWADTLLEAYNALPNRRTHEPTASAMRTQDCTR